MVDFIVGNDYELANIEEEGPTFSTANGESFIDVTIFKGGHINNWTVSKEVSLSDHNYVIYEVELFEPIMRAERRYKLRLADWKQFNNVFKTNIEALDLRVDGQNGVELLATSFQEVLNFACQQAIPQARVGIKYKAVSWWTDLLKRLKTEVNRARTAAQREEEPNLREALYRGYRDKRREYKSEIKRARRESFIERCEAITSNDPWSFVYRMLKPKSNGGLLSTVKRTDGLWTESVVDTHLYLLNKFFPREDIAEDTPTQRGIRELPLPDWSIIKDEPFTIEELLDIISTMSPHKAPGPCRIPTKVLSEIDHYGLNKLLTMYNLCLEHQVFPAVWKVSTVAWIPKPDGGYRPISLTSVLGRVLDKLCARRLALFLEREHMLNDLQFGFRKGKSTIQAISQIVNKIENNRKAKSHTLLVALDISNAFGAAWHVQLEKRLREMGVRYNLGGLVVSFLRERWASSGGVSVKMEIGCPQGSSLGPTLWLILMEGWFRKLSEIRLQQATIHVQAFADDQVILITGRSLRAIEDAWPIVWRTCQDWAEEQRLMYNIDKTQSVFFMGSNVTRSPRVRIGDALLRDKSAVKYLGVVIDRGLLWLEHMKAVRAKVSNIALRLFRIAGKKWGATRGMLKLIFKQAVQPVLLYGCEIWGARGLDTRMVRHLNAAQRPFLLSVTRAYRTSPTSALQVIAGLPPLNLVARHLHAAWLRGLNQEFDNPVLIENQTELHYRGRVQVGKEANYSDIQLFTDGSKTKTGVGLSVVGYKDSRVCTSIQERLVFTSTVFQAELRAILLATRLVLNNGWTERVTIFSDSKAALDSIVKFEVVNRTALETYLNITRAGNINLTWVKAHAGTEGNEKPTG